MIEAHQEGTLDKITNIFNLQENIPNFKGDMIRNPFNNQSYSNPYPLLHPKIPTKIFPLKKSPYIFKIRINHLDTNDINSINLAGLNPSNIHFLPLPGLNAAIPINPSSQINVQKAYQNLLPTNIISTGAPPAGVAPPIMGITPPVLPTPMAGANAPAVKAEKIELPKNLENKTEEKNN